MRLKGVSFNFRFQVLPSRIHTFRTEQVKRILKSSNQDTCRLVDRVPNILIKFNKKISYRPLRLLCTSHTTMRNYFCFQQ